MHKFNPGEVVTVTTKYNLPGLNPRTVTGAVLARPKWLQPNEIVISNPNDLDGLTVINLGRVIDLQDAQGRKIAIKLADTDDREWTVQGSKGSVYRVVRRGGAIKCSCPGFQFRGACRHIQEVAQ